MITRVVHCKKEPYDIYIGRPSKWGNPFIIGRDGKRNEVVNKFRVWCLRQRGIMDSLGELRGRTLGCWCSPLQCHGDVLAELADDYKC